MDEEQQGTFKVVDKRRFGVDGSDKASEESQEPVKSRGGEKSIVEPSNQSSEDTLPEADFSFLLISLATQAGIALGEAPHPDTGQASINIPAARLSVDLLGILQEKTKGNLTAEEAQLLENLLTHLRLRFVEVIRGR